MSAPKPVVYSSVFTVATILWIVGLFALGWGTFAPRPTNGFDVWRIGVFIIALGAGLAQVLPKISDLGAHTRTKGNL